MRTVINERRWGWLVAAPALTICLACHYLEIQLVISPPIVRVGQSTSRGWQAPCTGLPGS